ncbi:MAG: type III-B CRISPR module-associated protein Cmr3 [Fimbriimonadales bacterium]|nr:type III-B CRISPR module-associated protein Cmr3 [Fimbriimonadales bacterium]
MSWKTVRIRALDSLLFRDGRPFAAEPGALTARSLPIPPPNTVAGFLRTLIGERKGVDWEYIARERIYSEPVVRGPLPMLNDEFVLPAPADALVVSAAEDGAPRVLRLAPDADTLREGEGCDLPEYHYGMRPLVVPTNEKLAAGYTFWRWAELQQWLCGEVPHPLTRIPPPETETRAHVGINPATGVADEGMLYTVEYRTFENVEVQEGHLVYSEWSFVAQVQTEWEGAIAGVGALGGERRLAFVEPFHQWLECPEPLKRRLKHARCVRMYLATPAIFECGWKPGWIQKVNGEGEPRLIGTPPGLEGITLRLVAAAVPRRTAISGWSLRFNRFGPKPVNWCAPAGSVYFFEVVEGDPGVLAEKCWLESVSDGKEQNGRAENGDRAREAGFGLALWGVWNCDEGG